MVCIYNNFIMIGIIKISDKDLRSIHRAVGRIAEIECGMRRPTHKVHKNKKAYNRKDKHINKYG